MRTAFYRLIARLANQRTQWLAGLLVQGVAGIYYLSQPRKVARGIAFYRALSPGRPQGEYRRRVWRQYQNFTTIYLDRLRLAGGQRIVSSGRGWEHLQTLQASGQGAVILMSHLGNWEMAAHLMKQAAPDIRLLLYMGRRAREALEGLQKSDLASRGVEIVTSAPDGGSPFDLLSGLRFLQSGGVVSMAGDRLWHTGQRAVAATFLGHRIRLPETPHLLALLSAAPILTFFSFRNAAGHHRFTLTPPRYLPAAPRGRRTAIIAQSVQTYARLLEATLRRHPDQWYHFEPFLGPPAD